LIGIGVLSFRGHCIESAHDIRLGLDGRRLRPVPGSVSLPRMSYTRRELAQLALAMIPASALLRSHSAFAGQPKPNSKVSGVQIGMNVPYNFGGRNMPVDVLIKNVVEVGVNGLELRSQPVETLLGAPVELIDARTTDATAAETLRKWRTGVPMEKVQAVRRRFNDAGVLIEIVKFDGIFDWADDALDYAFLLAKNLGARAISTEIAAEGPQRLGHVADKHGMMVGYHGHEATGPEDWEKLFSFAAHNGANLDLGHFVAGNHGSPISFLEKHHDRITHVHVKDRKKDKGANVPFGTGDTPIVEALHLIRDKKWNIQATIEFEYPVPPDSDRMTELKKCVEFCRKALA
jgi:sugar phosphate isomerase/epimerase